MRFMCENRREERMRAGVALQADAGCGQVRHAGAGEEMRAEGKIIQRLNNSQNIVVPAVNGANFPVQRGADRRPGLKSSPAKKGLRRERASYLSENLWSVIPKLGGSGWPGGAAEGNSG